MPKPYKEVFKETKMELHFELKDIFGSKARFTEEFRQAFANSAIQKIVERTQEGRPLYGSWRRYSEGYKESLPFKAFGKTEDVNLTLTGDMLGTLSLLKSQGSKVVIGWDIELQNKKAFNHHTGDTVPRRPFFGLQNQEISELKEEFDAQAKSLEPITRKLKDILQAIDTLEALTKETKE